MRSLSSICLGGFVAVAASATASASVPAAITLRFGLRYEPAALARLHAIVDGVSTPSSPTYLRHLSRDEVDEVVRPPAAAATAVHAWLAGHACVTGAYTSGGGDWITATAASADCAAQLVGEGHLDGSAPARLPPAIAAVVNAVAPLHARVGGAPRPVRVTPWTAGAPGGTTPSSIRAAYGMGNVQGAGTASSNSLQIAGFLGEYAEDDDLQLFFSTYYPPAIGRHYKVVGPDGAAAGVEASLDVQYGMSIGANVSATFWYVDAGPAPNPYGNEPYLTWLLAVTALPDAQLPNTMSASYSDNEYTIDPAFAAQVEVLMAKLAARGTSMIHASGDGGVSGTQSGACPSGRFVPTWPASSIFATSVGATDTSFARASAFSSGSFSDRTPAPAWQTAAIAGYKAAATADGTLPDASLFNSSGRGVPDVAAVGEQFHIINAGRDFEVAGTSCSTPTFAGMVSLLNDARVNAGKRPLGLLNPLLYAHPEVFTDITQGNNPGCGKPGFTAEKGWDPITGLGAPSWPALLKLAMSLP